MYSLHSKFKRPTRVKGSNYVCPNLLSPLPFIAFARSKLVANKGFATKNGLVHDQRYTDPGAVKVQNHELYSYLDNVVVSKV